MENGVNEKLNNYNGGALEGARDPRDVWVDEVAGAPDKPDEFFSKWVVEAILKNGVNHQGSTGSCVGQSADKCNEAIQNYVGHGIKNFSPRFIYSLAKKEDGIPETNGTWMYMGGKILKNYGSAEESVYPSIKTGSEEEFKDLRDMSNAAYDNAKPYKIVRYAYTDRTIESYRLGIFTSTGNAVIIGYWLGGNMNIQPQTAPTIGRRNGGHANCAFGYDKYNIYAIGSWGDKFGATLYLKKHNHAKHGEYYVKGTEHDYEVKLTGIHMLGKDWERESALFRGITFFDEKFNDSLEERIRMLRLIKKRGKDEVFAILKGKKFWISPYSTYADGRGVLWPDLPIEQIMEVDSAEFDRYKTGGLFGSASILDFIRFLFLDK